MPSPKTKASARNLSQKHLAKRFDSLLAKHCLDKSTPQENQELAQLQTERRRRLYKNNAGYRRALNAARRVADRNTALVTTLLCMVNASKLTAHGRPASQEFLPTADTVHVVRSANGYCRWFVSFSKACKYARDARKTTKVVMHTLTTVPARAARRAWLTFDMSNGGMAKRYAWMLRSLEDAALRFYRHVQHPDRYADLSLPSLWYEIER